jgi:hypothetical protein
MVALCLIKELGMWQLFVLVVCGWLTLPNAGYFATTSPTDANQRLQQELNVSEDLRSPKQEWHRELNVDQPAHMTPTRVHGGIMPD